MIVVSTETKSTFKDFKDRFTVIIKGWYCSSM